MLSLLCLTSPFLYDLSVLTMDFQGMIFVGMTLYTVSALLDDGPYSSHKCILYFVITQNCAISNIYCFQPIMYGMIMHKVYRKIE